MTEPQVSDGDGPSRPRTRTSASCTRSGHFGEAGPPPSLPSCGRCRRRRRCAPSRDAPKDEVPNSVRLAVLYDLARQGFPDRDSAQAEYRRLAESIIGRRSCRPRRAPEGPRRRVHARGSLPRDAHRAGPEPRGGRLRRGGRLHGAAGEGRRPHGHVDLLRVRHRRPLREGVGVGRPSELATPRAVHVQEDGRRRLATARSRSPSRGTTTGTASSTRRSSSSTGSARSSTATTARTGTASPGMTFELAFSPDGQLDVDRGFITVTNTGLETGAQGCRVQALKIVGFTDDGWDAVAAVRLPVLDRLPPRRRPGRQLERPQARDPSLPATGPGSGPGRPRRCVDGVLRRVGEDVPRPLRGHERPCRVGELLALGLACGRVALLVPARQGLGAGLDVRTGTAARGGPRPRWDSLRTAAHAVDGILRRRHARARRIGTPGDATAAPPRRPRSGSPRRARRAGRPGAGSRRGRPAGGLGPGRHRGPDQPPSPQLTSRVTVVQPPGRDAGSPPEDAPTSASPGPLRGIPACRPPALQNAVPVQFYVSGARER